MKYFLLIVLLSFSNGQLLDSNPQVVDQSQPSSQPDPSPPTITESTSTPNIVDIPDIPYVIDPQFDYAEALAKSMLFYEAQRSGKLPENQRVKWRGDSAMSDGQDEGYDLTGGYYDGASYVKYGYTMAFMTTVLSWGAIRYRRAYEVLDQLPYLLDTIKWATDYFIKCHPTEYVLYGQVSDKAADSQYMGRPENITYFRKSYKIDAQNPGSDLAAETAAAMAAASVVFFPTMREYSETLLSHAEDLYRFASIHKGKYSDSIHHANQAYGSSEFRDDLSWAAAWLYRRTGDQYYLAESESYYDNAKLNTLATEFSWSTKQAGVQVLLAELTRKKKYRNAVQLFCDYAQPESKNTFRTKSRYTLGGLLYINQWGPLRYAANSAFLCAMAADQGIDSAENRIFATKQMNYILGENGRSFVVGFGTNPPIKPYHKSSYCPPPPAEACPPFDDDISNAHILYGAMVGGPGADDSFRDQRSNEKQSSVTIDFNAGFQSALAALLDLFIFGDNRRPKIDRPGDITVEKATLPPATVPPTPKSLVGPDWINVLKKSLLFYEAQRSGRLGIKNRISWRKDSALKDGFNNFDLSGGYYDGVGYIKYGFPQCFSMTMLAWSLIEYEDAYKIAGEYKNALDALQWGMEYILKCHIHQKVGENSTIRMIVGQVGDYSDDQQTWDRPENINETRPVYLISPEHPGTELSAEMTASLAAASIVFKNADSDNFASLLYNHSIFIFRRYVLREPKQTYTAEITSAIEEYPSTGFQDEVAWAAAWLNENRKHQFFYQRAMRYYPKSRPSDFSWDNKTAGVQLLLGVVNRKSNDIALFCNWLIDNAPRTEKGMLFLNEKYPAQYAANAAFILQLSYEKFRDHERALEWRDFAYRQMEYLIGSTGRSYVIGYGPNQPTQPYHKASSCPDLPKPCGFQYKDVDSPNPQKLSGALVGGPNRLDEFEDKRLNKDQSHVSLVGNAGFQAAVAGIYHLKINNLGGTANGVASPSLLILLLNSFIIFSITLWKM